MKFVAHKMVSILQNVSQNRDASNRKITISDIKNAMAGAYLSFYPGKTMYATGVQRHLYAHFSHGHIACIKGVDGGKASVLWIVQFHTGGNKEGYAIDPESVECGVVSESLPYQHAAGVTKYQGNALPSGIHKDLTIQKDEIKILVECILYFHENYNKYADGRTPTSAREVFKFLCLVPKPNKPGGRGYFNSVVIFTPNPGLFDETAPKE
jgi:hypothetical protein